MVLEIAEIGVVEGSEQAFEAAAREALALLGQAPGFQHAEWLKVIERPHEYRLLVRWDSLESHTKGFQQSALFGAWRALLGPYFRALPQVVHCRALPAEG